MARLNVILTDEAPVPTSGYSQAIMQRESAGDIRLSWHGVGWLGPGQRWIRGGSAESAGQYQSSTGSGGLRPYRCHPGQCFADRH